MKINSTSNFDDIDEVIADPMRFKAKLGIGTDAYKLLRTKDKVSDVYEGLGAIGTGAAVAKSGFVASTFFASTSVWSFLGISAGAATPIGWVIAAGAVAGAAWYGLSYVGKQTTSSMTTVIPNFINTPMDVLGANLFNFIAPLALKIASIDNEIHKLEREHISEYLHKEWGFNADFLAAGLSNIENSIESYEIGKLSKNLVEYTKQNPDCNQKAIYEDILNMLRGVMHADGVIDHREEIWISHIEVWLTGKSTQKGLNKFF
jgi:hypothetical protein